MAFASLLFWGFYQLVSRQAGQIAALVSTLLLVSSPHFLQLSVSVMIELPAMALGLAATLAFFVCLENGRKFWLVLSGVLMGCALQTKLTAAIFFLALVVQWMVSMPCLTLESQSRVTLTPTARLGRLKRALKSLAIWSAAIFLSFGFITWLYPGEGIDLLWNSHASAAAAIRNSEGHAFRTSTLLNDYECLFSAVAGTGLILWQRRWRHLFPVVLLGTVVLIHLTHRPYWYFEADYAPSPNADMKGSYLLKTVLAEPRGNGSRSRITTPGQQPMR